MLSKWLCNCNFCVLTSGNVHHVCVCGGGSIDTQLLKWLCNCNFSVLTSENVHLRWGGQSTLNFWSDFATATFMYSPLEMFTLGGLINTQLLKWLCNCNFSVLTSENVHLRWGGVDRHSTFEVTLQLKCFATATFLYSPLEMFTLGGGGQSTLNFWSDFVTATFLYSPLEMFTLGGGGVDQHSTFKVT